MRPRPLLIASLIFLTVACGQSQEDQPTVPARPTVAPGQPPPKGCPAGRVAFTFDDGPDPVYTRYVTDVLKAWKAHGTFFVVGVKLQAHPEMAAELRAGGHWLGNHSWSHRDLADLHPSDVNLELTSTNDILADQGLARLRLWRPPFGSTSKGVNAKARQLGMRLVASHGANIIDSYDYRGARPAQIHARIVPRLKAGTIVVMHDGLRWAVNDAAALPPILKAMYKAGLCTGPVRKDADGT